MSRTQDTHTATGGCHFQDFQRNKDGSREDYIPQISFRAGRYRVYPHKTATGVEITLSRQTVGVK